MAEKYPITETPSPAGSNPKVPDDSVHDQICDLAYNQPPWATHQKAPGKKRK